MGQMWAVSSIDRKGWHIALSQFVCALFVLFLALPRLADASGTQLVTWDALLPEAKANLESAAQLPQQATDQSFLKSHSTPSAVQNHDPLASLVRPSENWDAHNYDTSAAVLNRPVLIDGYVLPLAWEGVRVIDFLLVPWVGACIHMPTPPPNQIIHVSYPEGLVLEKQFEAVRLSGVLQNVQANHDLFLVDGQRNISVSYVLNNAQTAGSPGKVIAMSASDLPTLAKLQIWINGLFTNSMEAIAQDGSSKAIIFALIISFGYGALHTLGPGHGKSVVISYFAGTGGSLRRGLTMGFQIAVFHVLSAIVLVFLLDLAVRQVTGSAPSDYRIIRLGSYALIIVIGAVMLWQAISTLRQRRKNHGQFGHDHTHAHSHDHSHDSHSGCAACAAAANPKGGRWIAASVGIVPCTGALLVMLFGLANDLVWPAIMMVIAISMGMALAMSAIGVVALYGRQVAEKRFAGRPGGGVGFEIGARIAGATCVFAIGILLFVMTLSYPPVLQTPLSDISASHSATTFVPG